MIKKAELERQRLDAELEKKNNDQNLLTYRAIETAKSCYESRTFTNIAVSSMNPDDVANQAMIGLLQKKDLAGKSIGK